MLVHISYAANKYLGSQEYLQKTALTVGGFDRSYSYGIKDLDPDFVTRNQGILNQPRGAGYWLWKPHLIQKTLKTMKDTDWLMYTDAGCFFEKPIRFILQEEEQNIPNGMLMFEGDHPERMYTKRDAFVLMGLDSPPYTDTLQCTATFLLLRKTPFVEAFVEEWLTYAQDIRILTDIGNTQGLPNYPEFKDHRHDQSILSLLGKKHGVRRIEDPSQWGDLPHGSREPNHTRILIHHRNQL